MASNFKYADKATQQMIKRAADKQLDTVWDRYEAMQPQCGFGTLGLCCRHCSMGPCRIDPFGNGPQTGVCGATGDTIAARHLVRMIAAGAGGDSPHWCGAPLRILLLPQDPHTGHSP